MAEANGNGNGQRFEQAAESAALKLISRWGMVGIMTIALPIGAWMANRLVSSMDKLGDSVEVMRIDIVGLKKDVEYLKEKP